MPIATAWSASPRRSLRSPVPADLRAEESYRLLFENNPNPMFVWETATIRFLAVNASALDLFGYSREQFLGMTLEGMLAAHEIERLRAAVDDLMSGVATAG
jgi:PAS domain S-box-containing protein